ncbi:hypothetical protein [Desulforhopalus singaporensis]|uniref:Uncharacterized protein n=1 Tax=Desulforhopalus singaporensis TaxID=91360 RepID=A0A1H0NC50_9BACT|nr:hypothetical protein [Desulforhopalus singaporensis]SDO90231.1 hypothetical protein SAMN05660330_01340 [Desulforhopalus singaporensis]
MSETQQLIENEWYIVRYSGEIPEIAYNSAIYHLTRAKDGPKLKLSPGQVKALRDAAVERYREIVLRDLDHDNIDTPAYRGVARSICNHRRFVRFCSRHQVDPAAVTTEAAQALVRFLEAELSLPPSRSGPSAFNCSYPELVAYAGELGVEFAPRYKELEKRCCSPD